MAVMGTESSGGGGGVMRGRRSGALIHENALAVRGTGEVDGPALHFTRGKEWALDITCPKPGCGGMVHGGGIDPTGQAVDFLDRDARCDTCGGSFTVGWLHAN